MSISNYLSLLGGLGLFLYGMNMMGEGLEAAAGDRLKQILEKLTSNRFLGVFVGAAVTAIIQSSSATTVMVVGFVNAKMMTLTQAVWIIMGANIGTTITGQLIALDISAIAPLIAFIGVFIILFAKKPTIKHIGEIIAGLGILFIGMDMMSTSMIPLRDSKQFVDLVTNFSNPLVGILVGAGFTALIQSSSASVGILQALANSGVIGLDGAVYVLFGQNIGTCITAILASIGTSNEAKETTVIHLSFNIIGTIIFTCICMFTSFVPFMISLSPYNAAQQIANTHTTFNVVTTMLLLPFGQYLAAFARKVIPPDVDNQNENGLLYIQPLPNTDSLIGLGSISTQQVHDEVNHMMSLAYKNFYASFEQLHKYDEKRAKEIAEREKGVNFLNKEIGKYISMILTSDNLNPAVSEDMSSYYMMLVDIERISDYAVNIDELAEERLYQVMNRENLDLLDKMVDVSVTMRDKIDDTMEAEREYDEIVSDIDSWRTRLMIALKSKEVSSDISMLFSDLFTSVERVNAHALNVSQQFDKIEQRKAKAIA